MPDIKVHLISISHLQKRSNSHEKHVQNLISSLGLKGIFCDGISALYRLEGNFAPTEVEKISRELLCDPVVEDFHVDKLPENKNIFFADVWYKPGVTDAVGDSVLKAIHDLKIVSVNKAFAGTRYVFSTSKSNRNRNLPVEKNVADFVNKQLLNPLVQECKIVKL